MGAGMTEAEAECWSLAAKAAGAFFALPELHPMDKQEIAQAIHIVQNKLLSRPTYRKYLELAKEERPSVRVGRWTDGKPFLAVTFMPEFDVDEECLVVGTKVKANVLVDFLERNAETN